MVHTVSTTINGKNLTIETGKLAKQANGSVLVSYGDTRVLVTACAAKEAREGQSFFPLTIEYSEKYYASGKVPGSFFRREGRPTSEATLAARMIDRPIRPLFPEGFLNDVQVVATIISLDEECDPEVAASIGASAALHISDIPFNGPTSACRVGRINDEFVINPAWKQLKEKESDMDVFVAGTKSAVMMVEGGCQEVPEDVVFKGIVHGHNHIKEVIKLIDELREKAGKPKFEFTSPQIPEDIQSSVKDFAEEKIKTGLQIQEKLERYGRLGEVKEETLAHFVSEDLKESNPKEAEEKAKNVSTAVEDLKYDLMREMILSEGKRIDGRDTKTIRPISTEKGLLPRAHGSALFTRGETQILAAVTLGTKDDEQIIDSLYESTTRGLLFHYNFPPFSVGECGRMGGQSRREIGHGNLAERGVAPMLPNPSDFPYTIRIVCETLESNGSSSMGSVCSTSMALMDAGIPFKKPVAGIAMGLIKESDRVAILSDILGDEDHLGDMDFKVAGTKDGVTAIQMDIKIEGVTEEIMETALAQAHEGRMHILGEMAKTIEQPSTDLSKYAPRITTIQVPPDKVGTIIGPGGKMIKEIVAKTGVKVDIEDGGIVNIASNDQAAAQMAIDIIQGLCAEAEVDKIYKGKVIKVIDFGAIMKVLPNAEGLLHISEIAEERVENIDDYVKEGDEFEVKVIDIDPRTKKIRLSKRALLEGARPSRPPRPRGGPPRGDRGGMPPRGGRGGGRRDHRGGGNGGRRHAGR